MDTDIIILDQIAKTVTSIDRKYRKADFNTKVKLKKDRDKAFNAYAKARLKLLEEGIITTKKDLKEINEIKLQIARARKQQTIVLGVGKFISFLVRIAT